MSQTKKKKSTTHSLPKGHIDFRIFIYKVLKQIHPDMNISQVAKNELNGWLFYIGQALAKKAVDLSCEKRIQTVTPIIFELAVKLVFPNELAKHGVSEGIKAFTKLNAIPPGKVTPSVAERTGLTFPSSRVRQFFTSYKVRIAKGVTVYFAAVLEYLSAEMLELSGNIARDASIIDEYHLAKSSNFAGNVVIMGNNKVCITIDHLLQAENNDEELNKLSCDLDITIFASRRKYPPKTLEENSCSSTCLLKKQVDYYKLDDNGYVVVEFVDQKGRVLKLKDAISLIRISYSSKESGDKSVPESSCSKITSTAYLFYRHSKRNGKLPQGWMFSNFSHHFIKTKGIVWLTAEHLFQALKFEGSDDAYYRKISEAKSPMIAKRMGQSRKHPLRDDWEDIKDDIMYFVIYTKFMQHKDVQDELEATGDRVIIENSPKDRYWGCGKDGKGRNQLGKTFMKVRDYFCKGKRKEVTTKVVNVKVSNIRPQYNNLKEWCQDQTKNIYIGRGCVVFIDNSDGTRRRYPPKDSIFANPFKVGRDGDRKEIIQKYRTYIRKKLSTGEINDIHLTDLHGKNLGCWCKPDLCHGDVLLEILDDFWAFMMRKYDLTSKNVLDDIYSDYLLLCDRKNVDKKIRMEKILFFQYFCSDINEYVINGEITRDDRNSVIDDLVVPNCKYEINPNFEINYDDGIGLFKIYGKLAFDSEYIPEYLIHIFKQCDKEHH